MWYATAVSATLFGLLISAFVFLSLVVAALTGPSGWTALGFTILFGTLGVGSIIWQSPIGSKSPPSDDEIRRRRTRPQQYPAYATPPPARRHESTGPMLTGGSPTWYDYNGTPSKTQYTGDRLGRRPAITRPASDVVPPYTADLRSMRASRMQYDESVVQRDGQVEERFATLDALDMLTYDDTPEKYSENNQSIHSSDEDPRYVSAVQPYTARDRYPKYDR